MVRKVNPYYPIFLEFTAPGHAGLIREYFAARRAF
jgi:hypothetical protein